MMNNSAFPFPMMPFPFAMFGMNPQQWQNSNWGMGQMPFPFTMFGMNPQQWQNAGAASGTTPFPFPNPYQAAQAPAEGDAEFTEDADFNGENAANGTAYQMPQMPDMSQLLSFFQNMFPMFGTNAQAGDDQPQMPFNPMSFFMMPNMMSQFFQNMCPMGNMMPNMMGANPMGAAGAPQMGGAPSMPGMPGMGAMFGQMPQMPFNPMMMHNMASQFFQNMCPMGNMMPNMMGANPMGAAGAPQMGGAPSMPGMPGMGAMFGQMPQMPFNPMMMHNMASQFFQNMCPMGNMMPEAMNGMCPQMPGMDQMKDFMKNMFSAFNGKQGNASGMPFGMPIQFLQLLLHMDSTPEGLSKFQNILDLIFDAYSKSYEAATE